MRVVEADGVGGLPVHVNLEVQMRSGGLCAVAHFTDGVSRLDMVSVLDVVAVVVPVSRDGPVVMLDADPAGVGARMSPNPIDPANALGLTAA